MRDAFGGGESERGLEWLQMRADRGDLGGGGALRIDGARWRAVARETAGENSSGGVGREVSAVEKEIGIGGSDGAAGGELRDGEAGEDEAAKRAFAAGTEHAVAIADGDETGGAVVALQLGGAKEDGKFPGAVAHGVAGAPVDVMQDRDAGWSGAGERGRGEGEGCKKNGAAKHA